MKLCFRLAGVMLTTVLAACGQGNAQPDASPNSFRLTNGMFGSAAAMVTNVQDTCTAPALTASDIAAAQRTVTFDPATATMTIATTSGTQLGSGTVRNNTGTLTSSGGAVSGACQYSASRSIAVMLTADNTIQIQFNENRGSFLSVAGMTCMAPASGSCTVSYSQVLTAQ